jgi:large subunit ribosomal protein L23
MDKLMVLKARVSEKSYMLATGRRSYAIEVPASANKDTIAKAVTAQYGVTVETVNIVNSKGKVKRTVRKGGRPSFGKRSDAKKAYVTLKEGDKLPFFDEAEVAAKDEDKKKTAPASREEKK